MKEKISKLVNVYKKYGFIGFCKKLRAYIIANYLDKISFKTIFNKKKYTKEIEKILSDNKYDRIILWRSSFGYNVPLFQRPQHIANNLSKNNCLVFYEVTTMTDKVKIYKKFSDNLYLFNYNNKALNKILMNCLKDINKPKYIQLYSTDWKLSVENIENYIANGFKFIYEYIDHISPVLSGTKDLPKNISDKYEYIIENIRNSVNIPYNYLALLPENYLNKSSTYYIYCDSGKKSRKLCLLLNQLGYKTVDLIGGYQHYHKNY